MNFTFEKSQHENIAKPLWSGGKKKTKQKTKKTHTSSNLPLLQHKAGN